MINQNQMRPHKIKHKNKNIQIEFSNKISEIPYEEVKNKYKILFLFSTIIAIISLLFLGWKFYQYHQKEKIAQQLLNQYQLTTLYSSDSSYEASEMGMSVQNPFVIGMIKIDKIDLNYPILSESNDELLRISLCRFSGPMPNKTGNLCIAGHNYLDNRFFGRLNELNKNDKIEIYDLSGQKKSYQITKKFEVSADDLSCTEQTNDNETVITLLTCDNSNQNKRIVIQAQIKD